MFGLTIEQITITKNILKKHLINKEKVYVFGSRVSNKYKQFSDLDLCIVSNETDFDFNKILDIRTDYENSELPIKIDVVFYNTCSEDFKNVINNNKINFHY